MKVYISIPITGLDYEKQKAKAERFAKWLYEIGHEPVNPFQVPAPSENLCKSEETAYYMGKDITELLNCHAVYMSKGWENSKGCKVEKFTAETYGIPVYFRLDNIPEP